MCLIRFAGNLTHLGDLLQFFFARRGAVWIIHRALIIFHFNVLRATGLIATIFDVKHFYG